VAIHSRTPAMSEPRARRVAWLLRVFVAFAAVNVGIVTLSGQEARPGQTPSRWVVERTAEGRPNFEGIWANNTVTPLERPEQWKGKTRLTDAEVAELQKVAAQIYENDGDAQFGDGLILAVLNKLTKPGSYDPGTGNYNQFWIAERDWHDRRTALITDPADGQVPAMTAEAQARRAAEIEQRRAHAFEDPEVFPSGERCVNFGLPRLGAGYNSYLQIVQTRDYVMIMNEMAHDARVIPLDGRPHADGRVRSWNGDSRGHWEGDTLVVDTTNFSPKSDFRGAHEHLHLVERFTRVAPDILNYEFTIEDATVWTRPWSGMIPLKLKNEPIFEYACHEGNDAIPNMLRGHRYEEREAAKRSTPGR
jgi:hypothetical protein